MLFRFRPPSAASSLRGAWQLGTLLALSALASGACTVVVQEGSDQCASDAECAARGPDFVGTVCNAARVCERIPTFCASNRECNDKLGREGAICRRMPVAADNHCVTLTTAECPRFLADNGDLNQDGAVVVGAVSGLTSDAAERSIEVGYELARRDWVRAVRGVPARADGAPRPLALLLCEAAPTDAAAHARIGEHLFGNVGASLALGPRSAAGVEGLSDAARRYEGLVLAPGAAGLSPEPAVRASLAATPTTLAATMGRAARVFVDKLVAAGTAAPKIAFVTRGAADAELATAFRDAAAPGGTAPRDVAAGAGSADPAFAPAVASLVGAPADVVACTGTDCLAFVRAVEGAGVRPRWVLSPELETTDLARSFDAWPDGVRRVLGVRSGRPATDARVSIVFTRIFSVLNENGALLPSAEGYDAFYAASFAYGALAETPPRGPVLAEALRTRLRTGGQPARANQDEIARSVQALATGVDLSVDGSLAPLAFDERGFAARPQASIWCLEPSTSVAQRTKESGLWFDAGDVPAGIGLKGSLSCF